MLLLFYVYVLCTGLYFQLNILTEMSVNDAISLHDFNFIFVIRAV
jgi:hypothetical protein